MRGLFTVLFLLLIYSCGQNESQDMPEATDTTIVESEDTESETEAEDNLDFEGSFEGQITYKLKFQAKGNVSDYRKMLEVFGDSLVIMYSKGRYKLKYINGNIESITYLRDNFQYMQSRLTDTIYFTNAGFEKSNYYSGFVSNTDVKILDRDLKMVTISTDSYKRFYYYDSTMYLNPEFFTNHNLGYDNKYYEMAKAPYLYSEIVYDRFKVIMEAVSIEEKPISDSVFELPDVITVPSRRTGN